MLWIKLGSKFQFLAKEELIYMIQYSRIKGASYYSLFVI